MIILFVITAARVDLVSPVDLFQQHHPQQVVGKGHGGHGQPQVCLLFEGSMNDLRQYALQSGFAADNLEDVFLSMVEKDNMDRKQRAKL